MAQEPSFSPLVEPATAARVEPAPSGAPLAQAVAEGALDLTADGVVATRAGRTVFANAQAARILGYGAAEWLVGREFAELTVEQDEGLLKRYLDEVTRARGPRSLIGCRFLRGDGSECALDVISESRAHEGETLVVSTLREEPAQELRQLLKDTHDRFLDVAESFGGFCWEADAALTYVFVSHRVSQVLGYEPADLVGKRIFDLMDAEEAQRVATWLGEQRLEQGPLRGLEYKINRADGQPTWIEVNLVPFVDEEGGLAGYRGSAIDVSERKLADAHIRWLATRDPITALANRHLLDTWLKRALAPDDGTAPRRVALLFVDLDGFKHINDSLGHTAGDELLREVAQRIRATLGQLGLYARTGGDEFMIVLLDAPTADRVEDIARRLMEALSARVLLAGHRINVTASIGIALSPEHGSTPEELLRKADQAMYAAKSQRGSIQFFSEAMNLRAIERLAIETEMIVALSEGHLVPVFHPVFDTLTRELAFAEVLARWHHPERGVIAPEVFIPIAENSQLIASLGRSLRGEVFKAMSRWRAQGLPVPKMSLNVSIRELSLADFSDELNDALASHQLEARDILLEVTESTLMQEVDNVLANLDRMAAVGATIVIDDFGVGYSNFSALKHLPVHMLKLDKSLIRDIDIVAEDAAIVAGMVTVAKQLRLATVAEGVERDTQLAKLVPMGCQFVQGHLLSETLSLRGYPIDLAARVE